MKALCTTTSNRIEYIPQFLAALDACHSEGWSLFVGQEPMGQKTIAKAMFKAAKMSVSLTENAVRLGPGTNLWAQLTRAFTFGAEAALILDDDVLLSPDALNLCDWYLANVPFGRHAGLCLCNSLSSEDRVVNLPCAITSDSTWMGHVGQGYLFTRAQWENFVKPQFWNTVPGQAYDWTLTQRAMEQGYIIQRPLLSRSQHIGLQGFHGAAAGVHPDIFPKVVADTVYTGDYYLV